MHLLSVVDAVFGFAGSRSCFFMNGRRFEKVKLLRRLGAAPSVCSAVAGLCGG